MIEIGKHYKTANGLFSTKEGTLRIYATDHKVEDMCVVVGAICTHKKEGRWNCRNWNAKDGAYIKAYPYESITGFSLVEEFDTVEIEDLYLCLADDSNGAFRYTAHKTMECAQSVANSSRTYRTVRIIKIPAGKYQEIKF